jgi:hypothetical protein
VSHIDYRDHLPLEERNATVAVYGDIEHARMLLADTNAESIESHRGAAVPASARPARSSRIISPIGAV